MTGYERLDAETVVAEARQAESQPATPLFNVSTDADVVVQQAREADASGVYDSQANAFAAVKPFFDYYGAQTRMGMQGVVEGFGGLEAMVGSMSYEEAKARFGKDAGDEMDAQKVQNFEKNVAQWALTKYVPASEHVSRFGLHATGSAVNSLPQMGATAIGGVGGFVGAGSAGAALGAFTTSAALMAGQFYMEARAKGASHESARNTAAVVGAAQGMLEALELRQWGQLAKKTGQVALFPAKEGVVKQLFTEYAKTVGMETAEEWAQQVFDQLGRTYIGFAENNKRIIPTWKEVLEEWKQTIYSSLGASMVLGGASVGAGYMSRDKSTSEIAEDAGAALDEISRKLDVKAKALLEPKQKEGEAPDVFVPPSMEAPAIKSAKEKHDAAKLKQKEAKDRVDEIKARIEFMTDADAPIRKTAEKELREANRAYREAAQETRRAVLGVTREGIQHKIDNAKLGSVQRIELEEDIKAIATKLRSLELDAVMETIDERLAELENIRKSLTDVDSKADVDAKVVELEAERQSFADLKELIRDKVLDAKDLKTINTKIQSLRARTLVTMAGRKIIKASNKALRFASKNIKTNQELLTNLIKKSGIPEAQQGEFISLVKNTQTAKDLENASQQVEMRLREIEAAHDRASAIDELKVELRKSNRVKKTVKGNTKMVPRISADAQALMDVYRRFLKDPKEAGAVLQAAAELRKKNAEEIDKHAQNGARVVGEVPREVVELIAAQTVNFKSMTAAQIRALAKTISEITATGRSAYVEARVAEEAQKAADIEQVGKDIDGDIKGKTAEDERFKWNEPAKFKRTLGDAISPWNALVAIATQHSENPELNKIADVTEEILAEQTNIKNGVNLLLDTVTGGSKGRMKHLLKRMVQGGRVPIRPNMEFIDADGKASKRRMSRNQMIQLYNQMRDPDLRAGLTTSTSEGGNGYTYREDVNPGEMSTERYLDGNLTADDKKLADGLRAFYQAYYERVNDFHIKEFGIPLTKNQFYSGYARRMGVSAEVGSNTDFLTQFLERQSLVPGSTIDRVASKKGLMPSDAFLEAIDHINQMETWITWSNKERRLRNIFSNAKIREKIRIKYGQNFLNHLSESFNNVVGTRREQRSKVGRLVDVIRRNEGTAFVGAKLLQIPKQMTAAIAFSAHLPKDIRSGALFAARLAELAINPKKLFDTVRKLEKTSTLLQTRGGNITLEMREKIKNDLPGALQMRTLKDFLNLPTTIGDRLSIWFGGGALYNSLLDMGYTEQQAIAAFDKAANQTQSSSLRDQMTPLELGGPFGKAFSLFTKQPVQLLAHLLTDAKRAASKPSYENSVALARSFITFHVAQMLFQSVGLAMALANDDDDEALTEEFAKTIRALVLGPAAGMPILGDILDSAGTYATNMVFDAHERVWMPSNILTDTGGNALKLLSLMGKAYQDFDAITTEEWFKMWHAYNRSFALLGPGGGLPVEPFTNILENLATGEGDLATAVISAAAEQLLHGDVNRLSTDDLSGIVGTQSAPAIPNDAPEVEDDSHDD